MYNPTTFFKHFHSEQHSYFGTVTDYLPDEILFRFVELVRYSLDPAELVSIAGIFPIIHLECPQFLAFEGLQDPLVGIQTDIRFAQEFNTGGDAVG